MHDSPSRARLGSTTRRVVQRFWTLTLLLLQPAWHDRNAWIDYSKDRLINALVASPSELRIISPTVRQDANPDVELCDIAYFVPEDLVPAKNYQSKISNVARAIEQFIGSSLDQKGFPACGIKFRRDASGKVNVRLITGKGMATAYNPLGAWQNIEHWNAVTEEVFGSYKKRPPMLFILSETYGDQKVSHPFWQGHLALGNNVNRIRGVCLFSSWVLRDELMLAHWGGFLQAFSDESPIVGRTAVGHRGMDVPKSELLEDGVGGCLHEVGHMLGLFHHSGGRDTQDVMLQGFRRLGECIHDGKFVANNKVAFADHNLELLLSSPYVNPEIARRESPPPRISVIAKTKAGHSVKVQSEAGIRLVFSLQVDRNNEWLFRNLLFCSDSSWELPQAMTLDIDSREDETVVLFAVGVSGTRSHVALR